MLHKNPYTLRCWVWAWCQAWMGSWLQFPGEESISFLKEGERYLTECIMCIYSFAQSCLTLYDPMDCSPSGSSVHRILQARKLEWVVFPSSKGPSWRRDQTCVSYASLLWQGDFYHWTTWEAWGNAYWTIIFIVLFRKLISLSSF